MNKVLNLLSVALVAIFLFTQCKSTAGSGKVNMKKPESVALTFTKHLANLDVPSAKELGTEETKKVLDFLTMAIEMSGEEELAKMKEEAAANSKNIKKANCVISGDEAKCKVCCGLDGTSMDDNEMLLKKQDGKWLVHISKEDMMEGIEEEPDEE